MKRAELRDLAAFMAGARERSFTRAAAKLGTSQSALSHTVRRLEAQLGLQLLTRTTRSVAPTAAGERLLETLRPALEDIDTRLAELSDLRDKPAGTIRINSGQHAAHTILWPRLAKVLARYPELNVEIALDQSLADLSVGNFDAGVRLGEQLAKDMVAVRIGPDLRLAVVGAPGYFAQRSRPRAPHDLARHSCINLRMSTLGGLYVWEFEKEGKALNVRVDGQVVVNDSILAVEAALDGAGLAMVMEDHVEDFIASKRLIRVLADWCEPFAGYHLYFPSRRQQSQAFSVVVDALRYRKARYSQTR